MGIDKKTYAAAKTYANKVALGFQSVTQTATGFTITFKDGTTATYNVQNMHEHANKNILDLLSVDSNGNLLYDGKSISPDFIDVTGDGSKFLANDGTYKTVTTGGVAYDDTQVKADIQANTDDIADINNAIGTETMGTTATTITGAVAEINGNQLDTVSFSADYKNIVLNRKNGLNPYSIPIAAIINHAKLIELADIDTTDIGNGKTLVYDTATQKHKYADSTGTDEFVKMDSTTDAHYLADLIDKQTVVNENGVLKVKKLDGQEVTIAEINYLKGLTMNVMDLVNMFSNGGVKIINTPVATYADLLAYDKSSLIDGISYLVYVLADETHDNAKTTYLIDKDTATPTYFGFAGEHRDFTTSPIDLANEVTGKLGTSNIDVDSLWKLLTINDTYKTLTAKDEVFGTHGAKSMYDELTTEIGKKANNADLTTHKNDTGIHVTTTDKTKWDKVIDKVNKTDIVDNLTSTDINKPLSANQGKILDDKKLNKADADKIELTNVDSVNIKEFILENCTVENKIYYIIFRSNCTELPKKANYFMIVQKIGSFTIKVIAKELAGNNNEYVCTYRSDDAKWSSWEKICTTSVADVPFTKLTLDSSVFTLYDSSSYMSYSVCNGMCTINCKGVGLVSVGIHAVVSNIPKPVGGYATNILQVKSGESVPTNPVFLTVNNNELKLFSESSTGPFWGTITYPVAE